MAEVVGVVASIASLIQISGLVAGYCFSYISAVKNGPPEMMELCDELNSLKVILERLHDKNTQAPATLPSDLEIPLQKCLTVVQNLGSSLKPSTRTKFKRLMHLIKWPLRANETGKALLEIERYKSLFNLALTAEQLVLSKVIEYFSRETNQAVTDLAARFEKQIVDQNLQRQEEIALRRGEKRMEVLNWLYGHPFNRKHIEISSKRQEHTAGAGKTFLSSLVIDELERRAITTTSCQYGVAHIYFNYKDQDHQTPTNIVSSLIKQLGTRPASMAVDLTKELQVLYGKRADPKLNELIDILRATLKLFSRVFFVFDALDECDEELQRRELLPLFHLLAKDGASIFLTSRPYPHDIEISMCSSAKVELAAKEEDVRAYVKARIEAHPHARRLIHEKLENEVLSALVECCKGMFLLVHFYIEHLCQQTTENQVRKALNGLNASLAKGTSNALNDTYGRAISAIRTQSPARSRLALKVLMWLVKARRTLTVHELGTAVAIEDGMSELSEIDIPSSEMMLEVCGGLVIVDGRSEAIQLAHYSVQEYLEVNAGLLVMDSKCRKVEQADYSVPGYLESISNSHSGAELELEVAMSCVNFLSLNMFVNFCCCRSEWTEVNINQFSEFISSKMEKYGFLDYTARYLDSHIQSNARNIPAALILRFLQKHSSLHTYVMARASKTKYCRIRDCITSPLHEASRWGISTVVHGLLATDADINAWDEDQRTPLFTAAYEGRHEVVQVLVEKGANIEAPDEDQWTPLFAAAYNGHRQVVQVLVEKGANIETQNRQQWTPLFAAACAGHHQVVQLLVEKGANIEARNNDQWTPLFAAALAGHLQVVQVLVEKEADIDAGDEDQHTPLFAAAYNGHHQVATVLVEKGADIEALDSYQWTPLHAAARHGRHKVVQILVGKGADIEVLNNNQKTPLYLAAKWGEISVVQQLLDVGADISGGASNEDTPLYAATDPEVIRLLQPLKTGAKAARMLQISCEDSSRHS